MLLNISKETKLATVLEIHGFSKAAINDFFGHYTNVFENSVMLGHKYFGLPDYEIMTKLFRERS